MSEWRASVAVCTADEARRLSGYLTELLEPPADAVTSFEEPAGGYRVDAYFATEPEGTVLAEAISMAGLPTDLAPDVSRIEPENWVAKVQAGLPPVGAGRFYVHGSHDRANAGWRLNAIEIDAGEAFGTAHHATTHGCLQAIDRLARMRPFRNVLDLGCGSGVLAIAAAYVWPHARIAASDYDPIAIAVARANAIRNGVRSRISFAVAAGVADEGLRRRQPFDLIVANILAQPLISLAPSLAKVLQPGGRLVLSGILVPQAAQVRAAYHGCAFAIERHDIQNGWATLTLAKRGP